MIANANYFVPMWCKGCEEWTINYNRQGNCFTCGSEVTPEDYEREESDE